MAQTLRNVIVLVNTECNKNTGKHKKSPLSGGLGRRVLAIGAWLSAFGWTIKSPAVAGLFRVLCF
jgi:hypothetical protein